jgi:hypothetical protein
MKPFSSLVSDKPNLDNDDDDDDPARLLEKAEDAAAVRGD